MSKKRNQTEEVELTAASFEALPDSEKNRIFQEIEDGTPEQRLADSRPLNKEERAWWREWKRRRGGRPKVGQGSKMIALTVELGLLKRADSFAKAKGLKRSELFAKGVELVMRRSKAS